MERERTEIVLTRFTVLIASIGIAILSFLISLIDAEGYMKLVVVIFSLFFSIISTLLIWISLNIAYFHISPRIIKLKDLMKNDYRGILTLAPSYLVDVEAKPLFKAPFLKRINIAHSYHVRIVEITYRGDSILNNCTRGPQSTCSCTLIQEQREKKELPVVKLDSEITIEYEADKDKIENSSSKVYFEIEIDEVLLSIWILTFVFRLRYLVTT